VGNSDDRPVVHGRFHDDVDFSFAQGTLQAGEEPDPAEEGPIPGTKSRSYQ
jgi:hypothetical protein